MRSITVVDRDLAAAGTLETTVGRARAATTFKLLAKGAASSMKADARVVWADLQFFRDIGNGTFLEIDLFENSRVAFMQRRQQPTKASTNLGSQLRIRDLGIPLVGDRVERARLRSAPAVVIRDGIPEDGEEPMHCPPGVVRGNALLDGSRIGRLEDLLRRHPVPDAPLEKRQETPVVLDQYLDDVRVENSGSLMIVHVHQHLF